MLGEIKKKKREYEVNLRGLFFPKLYHVWFLDSLAGFPLPFYWFPNPENLKPLYLYLSLSPTIFISAVSYSVYFVDFRENVLITYPFFSNVLVWQNINIINFMHLISSQNINRRGSKYGMKSNQFKSERNMWW